MEDKVELANGKWTGKEKKAEEKADRPNKKPAAHEVGPSRRAQARERKGKSDDPWAAPNITITRQFFSDFADGKSQLNIEQLGRMLRAVSGATLSDDDVKYIMEIADRNQDEHIDYTEIVDVQECLSQYLRSRNIVVDMFQKYDVNHDGGLEHSELSNLLTELNDGIKVPDDEVAWVMTSNSKGSKMKESELQSAINFWYNYTDDPPDNIFLRKDKKKGGIIGRAMTSMHHHDQKHFEEHHQSSVTHMAEVPPVVAKTARENNWHAGA